MIFIKDIWRSGTVEPVRVKNGYGFFAENLKKRLQQILKNNYHINAKVFIDGIKMGTPFNNGIKECICVKNIDHPNYNFHIITSSKQGKYCVFKFYMGASEKSKKLDKGVEGRNKEFLYYAMVDKAIKEGLL
ncbi:MAG: hypothetical protein K5768_03290 [Firmicutes bacterium]|nr:hypothetical protein [Bacillota bacterium]